MRLSFLLALMLGICLVVTPLLNAKVARAAEADEKAEDGDEEEAEEEYEDEAFSEEDVLVLTKDNFDSTISSKEFVLVEFYAPWCGHCKALAPEYASAATELKELKPDVVLGKVDATEQEALAERFGVEGYPTLKWFVNGTATEYGGGRDEESIIRWIKKSTGPVAETVDTVDALKEAEKKGPIVIGYFKSLDKAASTKYSAFVDAAVSVEATILQTTSADVAKEAGGMAEDSVSLITNEGGERKVVPFKGELGGDDDELSTFVVVESLPLTMPFNADNTEKIFNSKISRHMILVAKPDDLKPEAALFKQFEAAAKQVRDDRTFVFVTVDAEDEEGEPVVEFFAVDKAKLPLVIAFQVEPAQQKFWYKGDITTDGIVKFAKGIVDESIQPEFQSQEPPNPDVEDNVKIVVGKTFTEVTTDPTKDVMLEVYAPWCGHCKSLEPIYKELGARFKDIDSVVIAKLDGTANEHKDLQVDGYPTIMFFPAEKDAEMVEFEGDRELEELTKFIKEHAKSKFEVEYNAPTEDAVKDAPKEDDKKDEL